MMSDHLRTSQICISKWPLQNPMQDKKGPFKSSPLRSFIFVNIVDGFPRHHCLHQSSLTFWGLGWLPIHSSPGRCCRVRRAGDQENSVDSVDVWFLCRLIPWSYYIFLDVSIPYGIGTSSSLGEQLEENIICIFLCTIFFGICMHHWHKQKALHSHAVWLTAVRAQASCCWPKSFMALRLGLCLVWLALGHDVQDSPRARWRREGRTGGGSWTDTKRSIARKSNTEDVLHCTRAWDEHKVERQTGSMQNSQATQGSHKPLKGGHEETCEDVHPWY